MTNNGYNTHLSPFHDEIGETSGLGLGDYLFISFSDAPSNSPLPPIGKKHDVINFDLIGRLTLREKKKTQRIAPNIYLA